MWRDSEPPLCEALRLFWLCGAGSGESTGGGGWETSHRASNSVQPGIACRTSRKVSHRPSSYLVPKTRTARLAAVITSDSRDSGARKQAQALIAATMEGDVCQSKRKRAGGKCRQVSDKFLQGRARGPGGYTRRFGPGRALPLTSTSSCGSEKGRHSPSRRSGASIW